MDVFGAREEPVEGVDGRLVADLAARRGHRDVHYQPDKAALPDALADLTRPGDVVVFLGAGDIW